MTISLDVWFVYIWVTIIAALCAGILFHEIGMAVGFYEGRRPAMLVFILLSFITFFEYFGPTIASFYLSQTQPNVLNETTWWFFIARLGQRLLFNAVFAIGIGMDHTARHR